jgi:N,N'-diacetyllegionaminate synthase
MLLENLEKTFIVAEIGINHNGSLDRLLKMIDVAKAVGADAVKLQVMTGLDLVSSRLIYNYRDVDGEHKKPLYKVFEDNKVSYNWLKTIYYHAKKIGITCFSTPFSFSAVDFLELIGNPIYKISSGDITHTPLIEYISQTGKPMIISTGKSNLSDIERAISAATSKESKDIAILHCVSNYPTPPEELNLNVIKTLGSKFNLPVGFSDHSEGYFSSVLAVAVGARIIEKHFTLDKNLPGPDHWFSLDPQEFKMLVDNIRDAEVILGDGLKEIGENEKMVYYRASRSIVAKKTIEARTIITEDIVDFKRPGDGLKPYELSQLLGKKTLQKIDADEVITLDKVE